MVTEVPKKSLWERLRVLDILYIASLLPFFIASVIFLDSSTTLRFARNDSLLRHFDRSDQREGSGEIFLPA